MTERDLLQTAVDALIKSLHVQDAEITWHPGASASRARLRLTLAGISTTVNVQAQRRLNAATARRLTTRTPDPQTPLVVVAERVPSAAAEILRESRIGHLDAAGNAHIEAPPLFIHTSGAAWTSPEAPIRGFVGEGLKVIFLLLVAPEAISESYRRLAELSGVSHGVVQYTMADLKKLGHAVQVGPRERRLDRAGALLDRWAAGYAEVLRPKLSQGTFKLNVGVQDWRALDLSPTDSRWGGEPAAALATDYLRPARLTVHTRARRPDVMKSLRALPSPDGALTVVRPFWTEALEDYAPEAFPPHAVPDALTFADLLLTDDPRNAEVAALLRERAVNGDA